MNFIEHNMGKSKCYENVNNNTLNALSVYDMKKILDDSDQGFNAFAEILKIEKASTTLEVTDVDLNIAIIDKKTSELSGCITLHKKDSIGFINNQDKLTLDELFTRDGDVLFYIKDVNDNKLYFMIDSNVKSEGIAQVSKMKNEDNRINMATKANINQLIPKSQGTLIVTAGV